MATGSALLQRPDSDEDSGPLYDEDDTPQQAARERARLAKQEDDQTESAGSSSDTSGASSDDLSDAESAGDILGKGYNADDDGVDGPRFKSRLRRLATKRNAAMGGGLLGFIIVFLIMASGFSAFELVNLRENMLGFQNRYPNSILQHRRARSFSKMLQKMNKGTFETNINKEKFQSAFRKNGFKVEFGEDGKLKEFSYTAKDGTHRVFDLDHPDRVKATNEFFGGDFGREASVAYDRTLNARGATWRGPFARGMYRLYGFIFYDWLDKARSDKAKAGGATTEAAEALRHANDIPPEVAAAELSARQLEDQNTPKEPPAGQVTEALDTALEMSDGPNNNNVGAADYAQQMKDDPAATDSSLGVTGDDTTNGQYLDGLGGILDEKGSVSAGTLKSFAAKFADKLPGKILGSVVKGFNILSVGQFACEVKGTLNFVADVRNIMLTIELARFAVLWLSAADNQKAGILSSEALNIFMIYMHRPSPKGTYWGVVSSGHALQSDRSKFGTGRNNDGILGKITSFINGVPGAGHCSVVNNGFVIAGGFAVGIVAAIFSGGTELAANIATGLTLSLIQEAVFMIATPLLIKAGAHMLFNGYENSTTIGAGILSSGHAFAGMNAGANGIRPATKAKIAQLEGQVAADQRYAMSQQSLYDRYLNPQNGTSLVARVGMSMPNSLWSLRLSISSGALGLFNHMTNFGVMSFLGGSAKASADSLSEESACTDPQIVKYNIAADTFCNPIYADSPELDLDQTESILKKYNLVDDTGTPTDNTQGDGLSFNDYIDDCFRGRPGILYTASPDKSGNDNPEDDTCVVDGDPLPGDNVGKYLRYAAWWGYIVDRDSALDQVNSE